MKPSARLKAGPLASGTAWARLKAGPCLALAFCTLAAAQPDVGSYFEGVAGTAGARWQAASTGKIYLVVKDRALGDVLKELRRVSNYNIEVKPDDVSKISVTLNLPSIYWRDALDVIAFKYELQINDKYEARRILIVERPEKITHRIEAMAIKDAIMLIAEFGKMSVVVPDTITGTVTANLTSTPCREALDIVCRAVGVLVVEETRGVLRIARQEDLEAQMETRVFKLSYLQPGGARYRATIKSDVAKEATVEAGKGQLPLQAVLEKIKSTNGSVSTLQGRSDLIVTDTAHKLQVIEKLIRKLDRPPKQVHLSLKLIELSDSDAEDVGILWQNGITAEASGMSFSSMFPFSPGSSSAPLGGTFPGRYGVSVPTETAGMTMGSSLYAASEDVGNLSLGSLSFAKLNMLLQFIRTQTRGRVIQSPQLTVLDHEEATIHVGELVRYAESFTTETTAGRSTNFKEASGSPVRLGIQVLFIPHVTGPDNNIILTVIPQTEDAKSAQLFEVFGGGDSTLKLPQTMTRTVVTKMMLRDRETGIIAGLRQQRFGEVVTKIPVLGDIPLLGWLFRHRSRPAETNRNSNLLILITPAVIDFERESDIAEMEKRAREKLGRGFPLEKEDPKVLPAGSGM